MVRSSSFRGWTREIVALLAAAGPLGGLYAARWTLLSLAETAPARQSPLGLGRVIDLGLWSPWASGLCWALFEIAVLRFLFWSFHGSGEPNMPRTVRGDS